MNINNENLILELEILKDKKKRCFDLCTEIYKRKRFDSYVPERWYLVQRIGIKTMERINIIKNELAEPKQRLSLDEYANLIEEKRAIKEANVTSATHERWKARIGRQIDARFGFK